MTFCHTLIEIVGYAIYIFQSNATRLNYVFSSQSWYITTIN